MLGAMNDLLEALVDLGHRHGVLQCIQVLEGFDFHHHFGDHSERSKAAKSGFKKRIVKVRLRAFYDFSKSIDELNARNVASQDSISNASSMSARRDGSGDGLIRDASQVLQTQSLGFQEFVEVLEAASSLTLQENVSLRG